MLMTAKHDKSGVRFSYGINKFSGTKLGAKMAHPHYSIISITSSPSPSPSPSAKFICADDQCEESLASSQRLIFDLRKMWFQPKIGAMSSQVKLLVPDGHEIRVPSWDIPKWNNRVLTHFYLMIRFLKTL